MMTVRQSGVRSPVSVNWLFFTLLLLLSLGWPLSPSADQAQYFYDELGRLVGVMDGQGEIATYKYDAVGNLLSITRGNTTVPDITTVTPNSLEAGIPTFVTFSGVGLELVTLTSSNPDLQINSVQHPSDTVLEATLLLNNPTTFGPTSLSLNGPGGTISTSVTVTQPIPTLSQLSTASAAPGTLVVITGTGFGTKGGSNQVTFPGPGSSRLEAAVVMEEFTSLGVLVPDNVAQGDVLVEVGGLTSNGLSFSGPHIAIVSATATQGTPANPGIASAIIGQTVLVQGGGLLSTSMVTLPTLDANGTSGTMEVPLNNVNAVGTTASVTIPALVVTGNWTVSGSGFAGIPVQIVPTVTAIQGAVTVGSNLTGFGSGFQESSTTVMFSGAAGPVAATDVLGTNNQLTTVVPVGSDGDFISVTTPGGTSNLWPLAGPAIYSIEATARDGVPLDPSQPSANGGQRVTLRGAGLSSGLQVSFPTVDDNGEPGPVFNTFIFSVSPDGLMAQVTVPSSAMTGPVTLGASGVYLQIVPEVLNVVRQGNVVPGNTITVFGRGFKPGSTQVHFDGIAEPVIPSNIQPFGLGQRSMRVVIPAGVSLLVPGSLTSVTVSSDGGTSDAFELSHPLITGVTTTAFLGTPLDSTVASANIDQTITAQGMGFIGNFATELQIDEYSTSGVINRERVSGGTVAPDGTSMTGIIRSRAITSELTVQDDHLFIGSGSVPFQVVPILSNVTGTLAEGQILEFQGSGFDKTDTTVQFPGVATPTPMDLDSIRHGDLGEVTVPAGVDPTGSVFVITPGGSSESFDLQLLSAGDEEVEPNNTPGTATRIITDVNTPGMKVGAIGTIDDIDYYQVDVDLNRGVHDHQAAVYLESAGDPTLQVRVTILDKDLNVVFMTEGEVSTVGPPDPFELPIPGIVSFDFETPATGKYYVKIEETAGQGSAAHRYGLGMNLEADEGPEEPG